MSRRGKHCPEPRIPPDCGPGADETYSKSWTGTAAVLPTEPPASACLFLRNAYKAGFPLDPGRELNGRPRKPRQGRWARRPVFPHLGRSSLSEARAGLAPDDGSRLTRKGAACRFTNTSTLLARTSARNR